MITQTTSTPYNITMKPSAPCPCGSGISLEECCKPYISGDDYAPTAEKLMRSRYTAYVLSNEDYLLASWHESSRPTHLNLEHQAKWLGLKIVAVEAGQQLDTEGTVEFVARYKIAGKAHRLSEKSRFLKQNGRWFYLDGLVSDLIC